MNAPANDVLCGWRVGDRLWTPCYGTGVVVKLRARAIGTPEALVKFIWPLAYRTWIVLSNVDKLAADEPDRLPHGLQRVEVGQAVRHTKFGDGVVIETFECESTSGRAARIDFFGWGMRDIVLGGGYLQARETPASAGVRGRPQGHPASASPAPTTAQRQGEEAFVVNGVPRTPSPSRDLAHRLKEVLSSEAAAARAAACLRSLAASLTQRGDELPWIETPWLAVLDTLGDQAPQTVRSIRDTYGAFVGAAAREVRTSVHTSRYWHSRPGGGVWLMPRLYLHPSRKLVLTDEVKRVANARPDRRYGLAAQSAPVLLQVAQWLEQEFALQSQPSLWCHFRSGPLNGVATELARGLWSMWVHRNGDVPTSACCTAGPFDLLHLSGGGNSPLEYRDWRVLELLNNFLNRHPLVRHGWRRAEVRIEWPRDGRPAAMGVTLETEEPFGIARHWFVKGAGPFRMQALRVSDWPDATPAMCVAVP